MSNKKISVEDYFSTPDLIKHVKNNVFSIKAKNGGTSIESAGKTNHAEFLEYSTDVKLETGITALVTASPNIHLKHLQFSPYLLTNTKEIKINFKLCPEGRANIDSGYPEDNLKYKEGDTIAYIVIL